MTPDSHHHGDEKSHTRVVAMVVMILLVTVLLYQVIEGVQRRAYQRRREIRRQQWREFRMREEERLREIASTQPYIDIDRGGPQGQGDDGPSGGGGVRAE